MEQSIDDDILSFLTSRKKDILTRWKEMMILPPDHSSPTSIEQNGEFIFTFMLQVYSLSDHERNKFIKAFACTTVESKIRQHFDIGSFTYNVNLAKSEILYELLKHPAMKEQFQSTIYSLFSSIDLFLFHVVTYFNSKDNYLKNKKQNTYKEHESRLNLLGKMTSSFVHEFRNPLTVVSGFVQLLAAENSRLPYLDIILNELEQLKFRITQFLLLSKNEMHDEEHSLFTLNELHEQILSFIYPRLLEENVDLKTDLEENLYVLGQKEEIRQVVINIIFNAIEEISVQTSDSTIQVKGYRKLDNIILEISNTGPQIPDSILKNIFEPFMTTKKTGTGLGLYISKQIIEKHNGQIICHSEVNQTTFQIILHAVKSRNKLLLS
ncbi:ATP-binding protein [Bacillus sp. FSL K6-3431]|uniref:ATP-binding protein n=1 Tax=Bacillus sp. FSL K6-3431 TaxID=2921500 RepID=UPI0030F5FFFE